MAPSKHTPAQDSAEHEELEATQALANARTRTRAHKTTQPYTGGGESKFFQFAGWISFLGGTALAVGPQYVEQLGDVAGQMSAVGLSGGTLGVLGLVLLAVGRVRRGQVDLARRAEGDQDNDLLFEQMATDLVQLRGSLEALQSSGSSTRDEVRNVQGLVASVQQTISDTAAQPDKAQDALFRLAASLDKMGARVEQRMNAQFESFQGGLKQVGTDILQAQTNLSIVLADLPKMVEAQAELKQIMGEVPKLAYAQGRLNQSMGDLPGLVQAQLAANLDRLRQDLPAIIRSHVNEKVDAARGELSSKLESKIQHGLESAGTTLRAQMTKEVDAALQHARKELNGSLEQQMTGQIDSARSSLTGMIEARLQDGFDVARDELAECLRGQIQGQTETAHSDLSGQIDARLDRDFEAARQDLAAQLGRHLQGNLENARSELADGLVARLQDDFERARVDLGESLAHHFQGDLQHARANLSGEFDSVRNDLSGMIEKRVQGDLQNARNELARAVKQQMQSDMTALRTELAGQITARLASDLDKARRELAGAVAGEVHSGVKEAMTHLPQMIQKQVKVNVDQAMGAAEAARKLDNPIAAERVEATLDSGYDAAYQARDARSSNGKLPSPQDAKKIAPPAPLPQKPTGTPQQPPSAAANSAAVRQTRFYNPKTPAERASELDTQSKLNQLNNLLADERLRSALDDLQKES